MRLLQRALEHLAWANRKVLARLREVDHAGALELLAHVVGTEEVWLARMEGRAPELEVWPQLDADGVGAAAERSVGRLQAFLDALDEGGLARECAYTNSAGQAFSSRVDDILLHVMLHGTYHRGQISTLLRAAGKEPAPSDFIAFTRGAPAATRLDPGRRGTSGGDPSAGGGR